MYIRTVDSNPITITYLLLFHELDGGRWYEGPSAVRRTGTALVPHNVVAHGLPKVVPLWMDACKSNFGHPTWAMALALQRTSRGPSLCSMSGLMN